MGAGNIADTVGIIPDGKFLGNGGQAVLSDMKLAQVILAPDAGGGKLYPALLGPVLIILGVLMQQRQQVLRRDRQRNAAAGQLFQQLTAKSDLQFRLPVYLVERAAYIEQYRTDHGHSPF